MRVPFRRPTTIAVATATSEPGWGEVLRVGAARAVLAVVACLLLWSVLPAVVGWTPRLIVTGSMEPRVHVGDVVVTREVPTAALRKGHVVTVEDPDHPGRTRTHRLVRRDGDGGLVLKGDANPQADSSPVSPTDVLGVAVLRVPFVGRPAYWLKEGNWLALGLTAAALGWSVLAAFPGRGRGRRARPGGPSGGASSRRRRGLRPRRIAAAVAAGALFAGWSAGPAHAAFTDSTSNRTSNLRAASSFYPYRAEVVSDGPYLFWRLDEPSGSAVNDSHTGNRDGTLVGSPAAWGQEGALTSEVRGKALSLTMARVNANAPVTAPTSFTLEAWIRTTSTQGGRIVGLGNATGSSWSTTVDRQLYLAPDGKAMFGVGSGTGRRVLASDWALNDGDWHHVVGVRGTTASSMRLYVDGEEHARTTSGATPVTFPGNCYWRAGAEQMSGWTGNPSSAYFNGHLDEVAIYHKTLGAGAVSDHYEAATAAP
jgi:signal peptidase I